MCSSDLGESEDGKVLAGDGTADGLALALTGAAGAVAAVAVGEEQTGTGGEENCCKMMSIRGLRGWVLDVFVQDESISKRTTLLHGETC